MVQVELVISVSVAETLYIKTTSVEVDDWPLASFNPLASLEPLATLKPDQSQAAGQPHIRSQASGQPHTITKSKPTTYYQSAWVKDKVVFCFI